MPSSLIIVALAAAWLIVLVPMVARKRQEVGHTADDALASRIVRRGSPRGDKREEHLMSESAAHDDRADEVQLDEPVMSDEDDVDVAEAHDVTERDDIDDVDGVHPDDYDRDDYADVGDRGYDYEEPPRQRTSARRVGYRPGRGGFDPEAAEIAARAKYAFRQRVVLALLATVVISAIVAGVVLPMLWWVTGAAGTVLAGYLVYLRRQVRIETEIRQRRLNRLNAARGQWHEDDLDYDPRYDGHYDERAEHEAEYDDAEYEDYDAGYRARPSMSERPIPGVERKPRPHSRMRHRNTVVVDIDDEDPAFEQLEQPGSPVYRRAVGE
ncbi:divisome protein SepX/GlpR [Haloechinothrix halophila]|uniref:divisome protein SepX/GlpR n=1 Tax=Haloechinothrix halophila TaxID=1069073 RepID=UPI0003F5815D|nr:gephyrin-like molybdotransferase receptor GlpR [Haloechinothrix halophila]